MQEAFPQMVSSLVDVTAAVILLLPILLLMLPPFLYFSSIAAIVTTGTNASPELISISRSLQLFLRFFPLLSPSSSIL